MGQRQMTNPPSPDSFERIGNFAVPIDAVKERSPQAILNAAVALSDDSRRPLFERMWVFGVIGAKFTASLSFCDAT